MTARQAIALEFDKPTGRTAMHGNSIMDEDMRLVQSAKKGDESAIAALFDRHRELVYRFVLNIVRNRDEAEDLTQEAFVRAFRNLESYQDRAKFTTWLLRIATNLCTDRIRMRNRRHQLEQDQATEGLLWMTTHDNEDPLENLEHQSQWRVVQQAMDQLPEAQRALIVMRDLEDIEYAEIAEIVGTSVGGAKLRVLRARRALRDLALPMMKSEVASDHA